MWHFLLASVVGVSLLWYWPVLPEIRSLWAIVLAVLLLLKYVCPARIRRCCIVAAGLLLGMSWSVYQAQQQIAQIVTPACEQKLLVVTGTVLGLSQPLNLEGSRFLFAPDIESTPCLQHRQIWQVRFWQNEQVLPGSRWQFTLRLKQPYGVANPAGFDAERFFHHQRVSAIASGSQGQLLSQPTWSVDLLRWHLRQQILSAFPDYPQAAGMLLALLTGDRAGIDAQAREHYAQSGISHLLAISGTHISLVALLAAIVVSRLVSRSPRLLQWMPLSRWTGGGALILACAYGILAGMDVPVQRALIMLGVLIVLRWLPMVLSSMQSLLIALFCVLMWDPLAVLSEGLWLSFIAVGLLIFGGLRFGEEMPVASMLRAQWLATWGLLPITVAFFARFSLIGLVANLIAIPLVGFFVLPIGIIGLGLNVFSEALAVWCWSWPVYALHYLGLAVAWAVALPAAYIDLHLPNQFLPLLVLSMLLLLMPRAMPGRYLCVLPLLAMCWPQPGMAYGQLRLVVMDVGQGTALLLSTAKHHLLYDTGPPFGEYSDAGNRIVVPLLSWLGVRNLSGVMLSHDDADHTGGFRSVLKLLPVQQVMGVWPSYLEGVPVQQRPLHQPCFEGQKWQWDGVSFEVLWPPRHQRIARKNDQSCVLRVEASGLVILIPGDLEAVGELYLLERVAAERLAADILLLGHHGSRTSTGQRFLQTVNPDLAIASAGYRNRFNHPSPVVVQRLADHGVDLLRSDEEGALFIDIKNRGLSPEISSWRYLRRHYWMANRRQNLQRYDE